MTAPGTAREEHQAMEFSDTKSALLNELSTTQGVVERKTTIPILSNLLREAKASPLTITPTDLALRVKWRPADPEAAHAGDGGHGRPPSGACGDRSQTHRAER